MRKTVRLFVLLAAAVLYAWAVAFWGLAREHGNYVHILLAQEVSVATGKEILSRQEDDEQIAFCFWGENDRQTVSCPETGNYAQVTRIFLWGNPELMGAGFLQWQEGCLVDEATAQTLFGTTLCGGQTLLYNGEPLRVCASVSAPRPTMLTLAEKGQAMNRCVLALPAENGKTLGRQFLLQWGLSGTVMDFFPLLALTENLLLLFPGILLLTLCCRLGRGWRELSLANIPLPLLGRVALALALAAGTLWLLLQRLVIPQDFIPSRWSDFSFWGNWWKGQRENLMLILSTPLGGGQLQILLNMVKSMGASLAAAMLALGSRRR